jgi:predicted transcriptional regulator
MAVLWADSPLSAADVAKRAPASRNWSPTTVKTMLARLVEKGALAAEAEGRRFLYRPLIAHDRLAGAQARRLVDRLFGGRVSPLVAHLAERRDLEPEDLAELEKLVRDLRK